MKTLLYLSNSKNMKVGIFTIIKLKLSNQHPEDTVTGIVSRQIDMKPAPYLC